MRWLWIMMPEDLDNMKELLPTADILYVYYLELSDTLLSLIKPSQILCVFAEALQDTKWNWAFVREKLSRIAYLPNFKILVTPTDPNYAEIAREIKAEWFPEWPIPPFVFMFEPAKPKETFFLFYGAEVSDKGLDVVWRLLGKVPIVGIGVWQFSRGFVYTTEALWLQSRSFALLHPSRNDSFSRTLASAMLLEQVPILLRTVAAYFRTWTFGWSDTSFLETVPIANSIEEFLEIAENAFRNPTALTEQYVPKMKAFMEKHREHWDPHVLWQKWKDKFGFTLPADILPLHNIYWIGRANLDQMPDGPWRQVEPSLNLRLR